LFGALFWHSGKRAWIAVSVFGSGFVVLHAAVYGFYEYGARKEYIHSSPPESSKVQVVGRTDGLRFRPDVEV